MSYVASLPRVVPTNIMPLLLHEALPELAAELKALLKKADPELAEQVDALRIVDRCRCGDDFCATIYTAAKPEGAWGEDHYTLPLDPERGLMIVDVLKDKIVQVEVLDRAEVRDKALKLLP